MKLSTVRTIYWVSIACFWALLIADLSTPGKAPAVLSLAEQVSVYVMLSASFYAMGVRRSTKKTATYEMSN